MASVTLPSTLTVEEEDEFDPSDRYGEPTNKIITVKFGDHEVARYHLSVDVGTGSFWYYRQTHNHRLDSKTEERVMYDGPDEFVADKLRRLFNTIN